MQNSSSSEEHNNIYACAEHIGGTAIWAFVSVLCFVLGFPASVFILWEMFRVHKGGTALTPNNFFILNLSIMDAVFLILIPPGIINHFLWKVHFIQVAWRGFYALSSCGRPLLMASTCLDCYVAVVHPIVYHRRKSLRPRVVMVAVVWTLTLASGIAYALLWWLFITLFPALTFLIAFLIIVICDSLILRSLLKSNPSGRSIHPQKQRAVQTLISSLGVAVMSYLIPILCFFFGKIWIRDVYTFLCTVAIPVIVTSTLGSAIMPWFFLYNLGKLECVRLPICNS